MKRTAQLLVFLLVLTSSHLDGQSENFADYRVDTILFDSQNAMIVVPNTVSETGEWVWRARFWGHQGQTDVALLEKGYHIVYVDVANLFGNKTAVKRWNKFYRFVRSEYKLNPKVALEGMSRGGLIIYNWASENTEKVACIYADAPVCDLKSWPGGKYKGKGSPRDWKRALKAHGQTEKSMDEYGYVPIFTAIKVAEAKIPALHICGAADQVVPYEENTAILAERFKAAGGNIEIILKDGIGHHPHSLKDPKPIVDFIEKSYARK